MGSRLQFGVNVMPSDWTYSGKLAETVTQDDRQSGFKFLNLSKPGGASKFEDGFTEVPCDFIGTTPVVAVYSQDGQKHRFTIDTGALHSYMRPGMAQALSSGREDPLPLCLYLPPDRWIHFKAEVNRSIAVLANPGPDFPADGILGMNALACVQMKIDYKHRKLWVRASPQPMDTKSVSAELGASPNAQVASIPLTRQDSGRYTVDVSLGGKSLPLEFDTGANVLGVAPSSLSDLKIDKVGGGQVLVENGNKLLAKYLATDAKVGDIKLLWAGVREGADPRAEVGGLGPSILPHQQVLVDYPGKCVYTLKPTEDELVEQALGQFVSGVARLQAGGVALDMPDVFGASKAVLTKIQDRTTTSVVADLRLLAKGDMAAQSRLLSLYKAVSASGGHISILQDGKDSTIEIGN